MKDSSVEFGDCNMVRYIRDFDTERAIACTDGGVLVGGMVEVELVPLKIAQDINVGGGGAAKDLLRPENELGHHRVTEGRAFLTNVEGRSPTERFEILFSSFYETKPENHN